MRQEWNLVFRLKHTGSRPGGFAGISDRNIRLLCAGFDGLGHYCTELVINAFLIERPRLAFVERRIKRIDGLLGLPIAVGNNRNKMMLMYDFDDPRHGFRRARVDTSNDRANHRRTHDSGIFHARQVCINPELGRAINFRRNVEALLWLAHDLVFGGLFQLGLGRRRVSGGFFREIRIAARLARGIVKDMRTFGAQLARRHVPCLRRGFDNHLACCRTGNPHAALSCQANGCRTARNLNFHPLGKGEKNAVHSTIQKSRDRRFARQIFPRESIVRKVFMRGRFLKSNAVPVSIHLIGQHLGQRCRSALPHFRMRCDRRDQIIGIDFNPCVDERLALIGHHASQFRCAVARADCNADHKRAACQNACSDKTSSCPLIH